MDIEIIDETPNQESISTGSSNSTSSGNVLAASGSSTSREMPPPLAPLSSSMAGRGPSHSGRVSRSSVMDSLLQQAARLGLTSKTDKFMHNFNPENSNRERRKLTRKIVQNYKRCYDGKGLLIVCSKDLCDCLNERCPGCFFPCPKCRSCKCGHECRQFRKWVYESAETQGSRKIFHNPYKDLLQKKKP